MKLVYTWALAVALTIGFTHHINAQCNNFLRNCEKENAGAFAGFTLADAVFDELDVKGGSVKLTLNAGNTYRFLACNGKGVEAVMLLLADAKGAVFASNLTDDGQGVYRVLEINCMATAEYVLHIKPLKGSGCAGMIYALK